MARTWTIAIAAPCAWLTANKELSRHDRSRKVYAWRESVAAACTVARLPKGVTPVEIEALVRWTGSRAPVRDRLNLAPTLKAVVDGLTPAKTWTRKGKRYYTPGYGLLPDDDDRHVLDTDWALERMEPGTAKSTPLAFAGEVVLTIREMTENDR